MTIEPHRMAKNTQRSNNVVNAKQADLDTIYELLDEINFRLLTLEVAHNNVIGEINHINNWLNDFRGRHEILYNLPWYRLYIWLMPHMGLPHYPPRKKLKAIRIRDTMPQLRKHNASR